MDKQDGQSQQSSLHQSSNTAYLPEPGLAESSQEKQLLVNSSAQSQAIPAQPTATSSSHLNGIAGWLAFFMVVLIVGALLFLGVFFNTLTKVNKPQFLPSDLLFPFADNVLPISDDESSYMVSAVMAPVVAVLAIAAVVAISQRKRLGKQLAIAAYISYFVHQVLYVVFSAVGHNYYVKPIDITISIVSFVIIIATIAGLLCLYFFTSRRVKETLVEQANTLRLIPQAHSTIITEAGETSTMNEQNKRPKQPVLHEPDIPQQLSDPTPTSAETPHERQPVSRQSSAQPRISPVQLQYALATPPPKDVVGWLAFFMFVVTIGALVSATMFFTSLLDISQPYAIISIIMAPIVVTLAIATAVMVSRRKKLGGRLAIATLIASFLHTILMAVTNTLIDGLETFEVMGFIYIAIMQAIAAFLCCLYFRISRRAKETLVG